MALYFATKPETDFQGLLKPICDNGCAVYAMHTCKYLNGKTSSDSPFGAEHHGIFYPSHVTKRISGQFGLFSIQPDPTKEFQEGFPNNEGNSINKIEFNKDVATEIQKILYLLGIRHESIFPDLDGFTHDLKVKFNIMECHKLDKLSY